ncbi:MAG: hypothetical protein IJH91_06745 [Mogibacterium sp.]|nr:hypothetical protein [Mogibacterium sp.]
MENDKIVIARIEDKIRQAQNGYYAVATGFLDVHEQTLVRAVARPVPARSPGGASGQPWQIAEGVFTTGDVTLVLYGGYPGADRRILVAAPRDLAETAEAVLSLDDWLAAVRVSLPGGAGARLLTHRDYLGSVLGLGLERSVIGDILVRSDGADIVIKPEMTEFLLSQYSKAGRANLKLEAISVSELIIPEQRTEEVRCTVSSLRLDNLVSAAFGVSRADAAAAISRGLVSLDHYEATKADKRVEPGSTVVLRGKGKVLLKSEDGTTKKGKTVITVLKYK